MGGSSQERSAASTLLEKDTFVTTWSYEEDPGPPKGLDVFCGSWRQFCRGKNQESEQSEEASSTCQQRRKAASLRGCREPTPAHTSTACSFPFQGARQTDGVNSSSNEGEFKGNQKGHLRYTAVPCERLT